MKIRPVGAEFFHADRQTVRRRTRQTEGRKDRQVDKVPDMYGEANNSFSKFCESSCNLYLIAI
jgi:hypothetical protein